MATATRSWFRDVRLSHLDFAGILFAIVTGVLHVYEGLEEFGKEPVAIPLILAGLGFIGAVILLWEGFRPKLLYAVGIGYTGVIFVAYFVLKWPDVLEPTGVLAKVVEAALILVLVQLLRQS